MLASDLQAVLMNWTVKHSLHFDQRGYIGLSEIADCEAVIYDRYFSGKKARVDEQCLHRLSYECEFALRARLSEMGVYTPAQEIHLHGGLFQGHPDGMIGADLLEIKTLPREEWLPRDMRLPSRTWFQVQAYLTYTNTRFCHVLYLARDTGIVQVVGIKYKPEIGTVIMNKVNRLAQAVRAYERPACTCGHCVLPAGSQAGSQAEQVGAA